MVLELSKEDPEFFTEFMCRFYWTLRTGTPADPRVRHVDAPLFDLTGCRYHSHGEDDICQPRKEKKMEAFVEDLEEGSISRGLETLKGDLLYGLS
jgi:hypothetical protein